MTKGERELRKILEGHPGAELRHGRAGFCIVYRGRRMAVGGLQNAMPDRHRVERFLK